MKLSTKTAITVTSIVLGVLAIWGLGATIYNHSNWTYSGKEVFQTESEYLQFKSIVSQMDVGQVTKLQVLSSEPPITVFFSVSVPSHTEFNYGRQDKENNWFMSLYLPFMVIFMGVLLTNILVVWKLGV